MANELDDLFDQEGRNILVYLGKEIKEDPEEEAKTAIMFNPLPVKAIITQVKPESIQWRFYGIQITEARELIMKASKIGLMRLSQKIVIDGVEFQAYREASGLISIQQLSSDYIRVMVTRSK